MIDVFSQVSGRARCLRIRWISLLSPISPDAGINFPLICIMARKSDIPDEKVVKDLAYGMPIAGPVDSTPGLTPRKKFALPSYRQWESGIPGRNKEVIGRALKSQGSDISVEVRGKTFGEAKMGWITEPTDVTQAILETVPPTPRYGITEQHGKQAAKLRLIVDFRASGINETVETDDTSIPDNLEVFVGLASYCKLSTPCCSLHAGLWVLRTPINALLYSGAGRNSRQFYYGPPPTHTGGPPKVAHLRTQSPD